MTQQHSEKAKLSEITNLLYEKIYKGKGFVEVEDSARDEVNIQENGDLHIYPPNHVVASEEHWWLSKAEIKHQVIDDDDNNPYIIIKKNDLKRLHRKLQRCESPIATAHQFADLFNEKVYKKKDLTKEADRQYVFINRGPLCIYPPNNDVRKAEHEWLKKAGIKHEVKDDNTHGKFIAINKAEFMALHNKLQCLDPFTEKEETSIQITRGADQLGYKGLFAYLNTVMNDIEEARKSAEKENLNYSDINNPEGRLNNRLKNRVNKERFLKVDEPKTHKLAKAICELVKKNDQFLKNPKDRPTFLAIAKMYELANKPVVISTARDNVAERFVCINKKIDEHLRGNKKDKRTGAAAANTRGVFGSVFIHFYAQEEGLVTTSDIPWKGMKAYPNSKNISGLDRMGGSYRICGQYYVLDEEGNAKQQGEPFTAVFIAAPDFDYRRDDAVKKGQRCNKNREEYIQRMAVNIRELCEHALETGSKIVDIPAIGCGIFANNPFLVAAICCAVLAESKKYKELKGNFVIYEQGKNILNKQFNEVLHCTQEELATILQHAPPCDYSTHEHAAPKKCGHKVITSIQDYLKKIAPEKTARVKVKSPSISKPRHVEITIDKLQQVASDLANMMQKKHVPCRGMVNLFITIKEWLQQNPNCPTKHAIALLYRATGCQNDNQNMWKGLNLRTEFSRLLKDQGLLNTNLTKYENIIPESAATELRKTSGKINLLSTFMSERKLGPQVQQEVEEESYEFK